MHDILPISTPDSLLAGHGEFGEGEFVNDDLVSVSIKLVDGD
jgi:hypothetical protein